MFWLIRHSAIILRKWLYLINWYTMFEIDRTKNRVFFRNKHWFSNYLKFLMTRDLRPNQLWRNYLKEWWLMTYDLWPMTYDLWLMTYDLWPMTCPGIHLKYEYPLFLYRLFGNLNMYNIELWMRIYLGLTHDDDAYINIHVLIAYWFASPLCS